MLKARLGIAWYWEGNHPHKSLVKGKFLSSLLYVPGWKSSGDNTKS